MWSFLGGGLAALRGGAIPKSRLALGSSWECLMFSSPQTQLPIPAQAEEMEENPDFHEGFPSLQWPLELLQPEH